MKLFSTSLLILLTSLPAPSLGAGWCDSTDEQTDGVYAEATNSGVDLYEPYNWGGRLERLQEILKVYDDILRSIGMDIIERTGIDPDRMLEPNPASPSEQVWQLDQLNYLLIQVRSEIYTRAKTSETYRKRAKYIEKTIEEFFDILDIGLAQEF